MSLKAIIAINHYTINVLSFLFFKVVPITIMLYVVVGVKWSNMLRKETTMLYWKDSWLISTSLSS